MKLRYRLLLAIGLTLVALVSGIYLLSSRVVLASFLKLEQQAGDRDVERVSQALGQMVDELHVKSVDWASWDDTYVFMGNRNKAYIEANMIDYSIIGMQLDMILFLDQHQHIHHSKPVSRLKGVSPPVPESVRQALITGGFLKKVAAFGPGRSGFLLQEGRPMMVSVRPIHNTSGKGSQRGWIVFCRNLDGQRLQRLQDLTRLKVHSFLIQGEKLPSDCSNAQSFLSNLNPRFVAPLNETTIAGYTLIKDMFGKPILMMRMTKPRAIFQQGLESVSYLARMILSAGALFSFVTLVVLERFALSRLSRLTRQVELIGDDSHGMRVSLSGRDELSSLAAKINEMLAKLQRRSLEIAAKNNVLENAVEGISQLDAKGCFLTVNLSFAKMLGWSQEELIGRSWESMIPESEHSEFRSLLYIAHENGRAETALQGLRADGSVFYNELTLVKPVGGGKDGGCHCFMKDISERKRLEGDIEHQAFHDVLTGLPNRALFMDRVEFALAKTDRSHLGTATLFIDLDNFKLVNDSLGHDVGDQLLKIVADRLMSAVRPGDTVARLGGDEFTILLEDLFDVGEAEVICSRILESLGRPVTLAETEVFIQGSIGIAFTTDAAISAEFLLKNADRAMYCAKSNGKSGYMIHDETMKNDALERMDLDTSLRKALEQGEIFVEYQPLIDLTSGGFIGAEALARWKHPTRGLVLPDQFISIAEESGTMVQIGYWIMEESCRQMKAWHEEFGNHSLSISVNVSGRQLQRQDVVSRVAQALESSGLPPSCLKLEITESILMADREEVVAKMHQLKQLGVKLALDDFGTGFSSLSTLSAFPIDTLKIDRKFINRLEDDEGARAIVEAIIALSRSMKMDVTGEGVETEFQLRAILEMGCQTGQGFFFAVPLSADDFRRQLSKGGKAPMSEGLLNRAKDIHEMIADDSAA